MTARAEHASVEGDASAPATRVAELERRIAELEALGEEAFGRFTRVDGVVCALVAVGVPVAALWWFAR